jgi:hypothetical protein
MMQELGKPRKNTKNPKVLYISASDMNRTLFKIECPYIDFIFCEDLEESFETINIYIRNLIL